MMGLFDMDPTLDWTQIMNANGVGGADPTQGDTFAQRFNPSAPSPVPQPTQPPVAQSFPQSPISPENMAKNFAARGVPPPPVDIPPDQTNVGSALTGQQPYRMASADATQAWRSGTDNVNASRLPAAPATTPSAPTDITTPAQQQSVAAQAQGQTNPPAKKDALLEALRGVKAPAAPELQKLGTPAVPHPTAVKSGNLMAILQAMGATSPGGAARQLPQTLAAALGKG